MSDRPLRVLLVDDDVSLLNSATPALVSEGFDVLATRSGADALHHVIHDGFQPTVLIAGARALGISGGELADTVRDLSPTTSVVFLTESLAETTDLRQRSRTAVVVKPFHVADLVRAVHVMGRIPVGEAAPPLSNRAPDSGNTPDEHFNVSRPPITFGEFVSPWIAAIIMVVVAWLVITFLSR